MGLRAGTAPDEPRSPERSPQAAISDAPGRSAPAARAALRILGVDPGSRVTGFGLIASNGARSQRLASGCIRPRGATLAEVLGSLQREFSERLPTWAPDAVAVEAVFHQHNARSALVLGQARGALLAACGLAGLPVAEYPPARVKSAVTGSGAADKDQVQRMVRAILGLQDALALDESDALAVALCHAQTIRLTAAIAKASS